VEAELVDCSHGSCWGLGSKEGSGRRGCCCQYCVELSEFVAFAGCECGRRAGWWEGRYGSMGWRRGRWEEEVILAERFTLDNCRRTSRGQCHQCHQYHQYQQYLWGRSNLSQRIASVNCSPPLVSMASMTLMMDCSVSCVSG
jgi:hypothetical protein